MAVTINASTTAGLVQTADTSGVLALQTAGTTAVTVDASQNVGIGGVSSFDISPAGTGQYPQLATWTTTSLIQSAFGYYGGANTAGPTIAFIKSRSSTIGTNTAVVSGDSTGNIVFRGADGTNYKNASAIISAVDGTVSAGIVPGRLLFSTTDTAGTLTERMRLNSTGALVLAGGTTTANGIGITFPATRSASSDVNTLDDYEEGTWTPSVGGTATYGAQRNGWYIKVGNLVTIACDLSINAIGTGSTTTVSGIPFSNNAGGVTNGGGSLSYFATLTSAVYSLATQMSGTTFVFVSLTAANVSVNNVAAVLGSGTRIITTITYQTTD